MSGSIESIGFCSDRGIVPVYFTGLDGMVEMAHHYVDRGKERGRNYRLGERQCVVRWPHFSNSPEQTRRILAEQDEEFYRNHYGSFFPPLIEGATDMVQRIIDTGLFPTGSVDDQIAYWQALLDKVPCEFLCLIWHYAQAPKQSVIDELELFMTQVLPKLDVPDFPEWGQQTPRISPTA